MKFQKQIIITINLILILQSLICIQNSNNSQKDRQNITQIISENIEDNPQVGIYSPDTSSSTSVHQTLTQGTNKTFGFFTQDSYVNLDSDGNVFQWEKYDVVKDTGDNSVYADFAMDYSYSYTWPSSPNSYVPLIDIETGTQLASTFSPPFSETTYLSGKVYFLTYISTYVSSFTITLTLRIRLWLYNPNDGGLTEILTIESVLPDNSDLTQRVYSSTLEDKVTIPSGYRLKVTYEAKTSRIDRAAYVHLETGEYSDGDQVNWQINDAEYSNTYTLNDVTSALGVQLYMYDETYPTISISGAENNTIYYDTNEITISTSGAVSNSYKWDSNSYTDFDTPVNTTLPSSTGWHYLYVRALDEYDNKNEVVYKIGNEKSSIVLHNANNNSLVPNNFLLNFSLSGYDSAQYAWDSGGNYTFSDPYDISVPDFSGEHTLYIYTVSSFGENKTVYVFEVDNSPPLISLRDLSNDTTQPTNKKIELNITDQTSTIEVLYNWDNAANSTWSPLEGTIYQTFAPDTDGFHWLNVYANDSFGHIIDVHYRFNISSDYLLVELRTMVNDSYYYGGNTVEVTITGTNGTIKYQWDSNGFKDGVTVDSILSLSGSESLPKDLGVHYLTIVVGDVDGNPYSFLFKFTIDQENPVVSNFENYNNSRLLSSTIIDLEITDNFTLSSEIEAWVSIDGGGNISFTYPYDIEISSLEDGVHNITVFAFDIARNNVSCLIIFEIDTTAPEIDIVSIQGLEVSSSGVSYIPGNAAIECSFVDADPEIYHFYSWNNSAFTLFAGNTFILPDTDGNATLRILANDTLGNENILTLDLFIDTTPPQLSILFPNNYSKINEATPLLFFANDSASDTISSISAKWDQFLEGEIDLSPPYFTIYLSSLKKLYEELSVAELYIDAKDILGNNFTYIYSFNLDFSPPSYNLVGAQNNTFVRSNTTLQFENLSNDLMKFVYYWDSNDISILDDPWTISIPNNDGVHNLTVILYDNTGEGYYPNWVKSFYTFVVDDIGIEITSPSSFSNNTEVGIVYKQSFTFSVDVYDTADNQSIDNLNFVILNNTLNLEIENETLDGKTYTITIHGTNVGSTRLIFQFSKGNSNKHQIVVPLTIEKKEGTVSLLGTSVLSVIYEENFTIILNLEDENSNLLNITRVTVNGSLVSDFIYLDEYHAIQFNYSSRETRGKGEYNLLVNIESNYYYGEKIVGIEVKPIPIILSLSVSSYTVIEGSQVAITGTLTFTNGTPIPSITLYFSIYIVYKNQSNNNVMALPSEYGSKVVFSGLTNSSGQVTIAFEMISEIDYISVDCSFGGSNIFDTVYYEMEEYIYSIPTPKLPTWILYTIIGGSIILAAIISFVVYKLTRPKPFDEILNSISDNDIVMNMTRICPGVVLSIFDQRKGAIPLVSDHSLDYSYSGRIRIGLENFMLKISDQAYSSLGFEEHHSGRRTGTITLPNEGLVGFIHGIQLENKAARGGFENLSLIVLVENEYGTMLLSYQEYLYPLIDELISMLKNKKSLEDIEEQLSNIRSQATKTVLASLEYENAMS